MAPYSYIKIINGTTGATKTVLTPQGRDVKPGDDGYNGFTTLMWKKIVNDVGVAVWSMPYDHPDVALLSDKDQIEIWRADPDTDPPIAEYRSFDGIFRDDEVTFSGYNIIECTAYDANHMLTWREVAFPAKTTNQTDFSAANGETIMKRIVDYNCCANATTGNGRDRNGAIVGLTIEVDGARGDSMSIGVSRTNVLDALKKIAYKAGGDFAVVKSSGVNYVFTFYPDHLGTDRSDDIKFSLDLGNIRDPKLKRVRSAESTVAIVGGQGQGNKRKIRTRTGPNYNVNTNNVEMFIDGRNSGNDNTILDGIGDRALAESQFRNRLTYDVLQTAKSQVERDYFLGDLVTGVYIIEAVQQVYEVAFDYRNRVETAIVVNRDYP